MGIRFVQQPLANAADARHPGAGLRTGTRIAVDGVAFLLNQLPQSGAPYTTSSSVELTGFAIWLGKC